MTDKNKLQAMLDNIIDGNNEQAQVHFHDYLQNKMQEVIGSNKGAEEAHKEQTNEE